MCFPKYEFYFYKKTPILNEVTDKLLDTSEIYRQHDTQILETVVVPKCDFCQKNTEVKLVQYSMLCPICTKKYKKFCIKNKQKNVSI
jgi:hypothetical protein